MTVFSRRQQVLWFLALISLLVPYLGLMIIGGYALWQNGWFWIYGSVTAGVTALVCGLAFYLHKRRDLQALEPLKFECPQDWPPREQAAWSKVEHLAQQATRGEIPVESIDDFRALLVRLVREIAQHYHPEHDDAYLDTPLPQLLKIVEKVCQELRQVVQNHVPGAHILTLRDWRTIKEAYDFFEPLYRLIYWAYRIGSIPVSPVSALWREIRGFVAGQALNLSVKELKAELVSYVIHRMGFYLIELYSGRIILDDKEFAEVRRQAEQRELQTAEPEVPDTPPEFIRIVIVGQLKAGKSSLINALRGTWQAQTDVLPCTDQVQCYLMRPLAEGDVNDPRPVLPGLLVLVDTPGYDSLGDGRNFAPSLDEVKKADMVLLVCSARTAGRKADHEFLQAVRQWFQAHPHWIMPPLIVVGSFIDELRPRHEWNPPYRWRDVKEGESLSPKEQALQLFLEALRRDLELASGDPVIPVCTHPERTWNIAEGLIPTVAAYWEKARAVRDNRHREAYQKTPYRLLWRQVKNATGSTIRLALKKIGIR
ncbi:MAG TPA: 50S ribosome-binding GTPase [Thermogutta sp.]|nr:50S ribosome-binding GTPase [Thermogutta sp.]HQF13839.1 50S ribosome-binding GTPase [Thermogutta sp.]